MKVKELTNAQLIANFENACFMACNYPKNKKYTEALQKLEREVATRLGVKESELDELFK